MIKLVKILHINHANITLKIEQNKNCSDCKSHCNNGFLGFLFNKYNQGDIKISRYNESHENQLHDEMGFFNEQHKVNDIVGINFDDKHLFKLTALLYGLPILLIITMLMIGVLVFTKLDVNSDIGGIVGLLSGLYLAKLLIKKNQSKIIPKVKFFN